MTPEELEHKREIYRRSNAKKKAVRLAKEEAERAEILAGTSFENVAKISPTKDNSEDTLIAV